MSQVYGWNGTARVEIDFNVDVPVYGWDGTKPVLLSGEVDVPPPNPVPHFDELAGLELFMDAADPTATGTAPADKAPVRLWTPKQGGVEFQSLTVDTDTDEANDVRAPKYYAETSTEPAHLRFSGANRMTTDTSKVPMSGACTVYVVARTHHLGYGTLFSAGNQDAAQSAPLFCVDHDAYGRTRALRRTTDGSLTVAQQCLIANSWRVYSVVTNGYQDIAIRANERLASGLADKPSATGTAALNRMAIGARVSPNGTDAYGSLWAGDMAAVVVYSTAHDAATRSLVEGQLATRYKITLPSQGGTIDGPAARITAHREQLSREYGIPATQRVTGKTLPGFHNTGPAVTVQSSDYQVVEGTFTTSGDEQVVSKKWITGNIIVRHAGVIFRDCVLASTVDPKIDTRNQAVNADLPFVLIDRCELFGKENDGSTGIGYIRYTVTNSFLHDSEDNVRLNKDSVIDNNLMCIHSNGFLTAKERLHTDCVQSNGGDNDPGVRSYVRGNTLIAQRHNLTKGNSAVILATEGASVNGVNQGSPLRRVTVEGNYLAGGSFSLYIKTMGTSGSPGPMEDIVIKDNEFRGPKPTTPVTMRSGVSTASLNTGAFIPTGNGYGDAWLPYVSLADTFLTLSGNVREDGSAIKIVRSTLGGSDSNA